MVCEWVAGHKEGFFGRSGVSRRIESQAPLCWLRSFCYNVALIRSDPLDKSAPALPAMAAGFPSADRVERVMTDRESKFFISSWDGDVAILKLTDCTHYKMSDIEVLEAFRKDILGFLGKHEPTKIIVDFAGLWRIDCLSLGGAAVKGVMISAKRRSEHWHTLWKFCGMSAPVRQCHELSRLDSIFPMYDSCEKAVAAFPDASGAK